MGGGWVRDRFGERQLASYASHPGCGGGYALGGRDRATVEAIPEQPAADTGETDRGNEALAAHRARYSASLTVCTPAVKRRQTLRSAPRRSSCRSTKPSSSAISARIP